MSILNLPKFSNDEFNEFLTRVLDRNGNWVNAARATHHDVAPTVFTPNDPQFAGQWHLNGAYGINAKTAWDDYRGNGITIGFIDDGVDYTHADLAAHYNSAIDFDEQTLTNDGSHRTSNDRHGTTTTGMAAGIGNNGIGVTGVAWDADFTMFRMPFNVDVSDAQVADLFSHGMQVDVLNNSWGFNGFFTDDFNSWMPQVEASIENLVANGRGGLGTNIVFSSGNGRASGDDVNYHSLQSSQYITSVAATDINGKVTSFSTAGAAVLVSAPGANLTSTDRLGSAGYQNGDYATGLNGTSYSAPIVSGIVALMLDANPNLGYRDVQEILAMSARNSDTANAGWKTNGASNWNGGGMHFSHDYGYGLVDAQAAVRLAETWDLQSTFANRDVIDTGLLNINAAIPNNNATGVSRSVNVASNLDIDRVEVDLNITHPNIGDLIVKLTSPSGMTSTLINRPGYSGGLFGGAGSTMDNIRFTTDSNAYWGETGNGTWTITVSDVRNSNTGTFTSWDLRLIGDTDTPDDLYVYTNEFASLANANPARATLLDNDGGTDTINLAAISGNTTLNLIPGSISTVGGRSLTISNAATIENAHLGDGNDNVTGNSASNTITLGRGDDSVMGGWGDDNLNGGAGTDTAIFDGGYNYYTVQIVNSVTFTVYSSLQGFDTLSNFEKIIFDGIKYSFDGTSNNIDVVPPNLGPNAISDEVTVNQNSSITVNVLANDTDPEGDTLTVTAIGSVDHGTATLNANNTITYTPTPGYVGSDVVAYQISDGHGGSDEARVEITVKSAPVTPLNLVGTKNNDTLNGNGGNDTINGERGDDVLNGNGGNDNIVGDYGNDTINGGAGADTLTGGRNNDIFVYEQLSDAGDTITDFKRGEDKLDLRLLMDNMGYNGSNPASSGHMSFVKSGNNLQVFVDADGAGGGAAALLVTLNGVKDATLTLNADYLV